MTEQFTDPNIERALSEPVPDLASILGGIAPPAPPQVPVGGFGVQPLMSTKEARAAEKAADRAADQFAAARTDKTHLRKYGAIAAMVPGAHRIRVRKRRDEANLGYIGEYNFRDLASSGDLEVFLSRHIAPKHGPGEYDITIIDNVGREVPMGSIWIEGLPIEGGGAQAGMFDLIRDLTAKANAPAPAPPDPFEQMRRAQQLAKELKESSGGDPMAMMLMMQSMQKQGTDPILLAALERLTAKVEKVEAAPSGGMSALPPLPPPAPAQTIDWVAFGAQVALPLFQQMQQAQQHQQNMQMQQMQLQMQAQQQNMQLMMTALAGKNDGFTAKDALAMMQDNHARTLDLVQRRQEEERPQNTIEDQMMALVKMKDFAQAFSPPPPPGPQGASFWDALVALASSNDMTNAIADRIRQREAPKSLPQQSGAQVIQFPQRQQPQQLQTAQSPAPVAVMNGGGEQQQVVIPSSLRDDVAKIAMAGDAGDRVQATIGTLVGLQKDPMFSKFVMALLEATAKNETDKTLRGLGGWLKLLIENGLLTREVAHAVLKDFHDNWDLIRGLLLERVPMLRAMAQAQEATPTAPTPTTPSPTAPAPTAPAPAAPAEPEPAFSPPVPITQPDPEVPTDVEIPDGYGGAPAMQVVS